MKVKMVSEIGKLILHFELEDTDKSQPSENFQMGSYQYSHYDSS